MTEILHNLTVIGGLGLVSFPSSGRGLVVFPLSISKSRTARWGSQEVFQGLLRCLGGGITQGDARGVPWWALVGWRWHHSRRREGGTLVGSRGLEVTSLEETRGLLSRFDCVYSGYITQGCPGGALAVAMSLRARCFFFHTHLQLHCCRPGPVRTNTRDQKHDSESRDNTSEKETRS